MVQGNNNLWKMPRDYFFKCEIIDLWRWKMWCIIDSTMRISACSRCVKRMKRVSVVERCINSISGSIEREREREWRMIKARDNEYSCDVVIRHWKSHFLNEAYHRDKMNVLHTCILKSAWSLERFLHGSSTWKIDQHCPITLITLNILLDTQVLSWS